MTTFTANHSPTLPDKIEPGFHFSKSLLEWFDQHGRNSLPWQLDRDPYRIWISEIMLQQTQVETVIPFYQKFMVQFPDISKLAGARTDEIMTCWAGLGYYARARNLHRAAQQIRDRHGGDFPETHEEIMALPGIGRSTASAILAFSQNARHAILDGNVKRVLSRCFAIPGYPGNRAVEKTLWALAEQLTPVEHVADYTQAIMDLGATLCTRHHPDCSRCPLQQGCIAFRQDTQEAYPGAKPKTPRPKKLSRMLLLRNSRSEYLLVKRPPSGIWGGMWVLPEVTDPEVDIQQWCDQELGVSVGPCTVLETVHHGFTHFALDIQPLECVVGKNSGWVMDADNYLWYNPLIAAPVGIPTAVEKIFNQLG